MSRIVAVAGSYRADGIIDQAMQVAARAAEAAGAEVDVIQLRECSIGFCRNCRECTQQAGDRPGRCVQDDEMQSIVEKIEAADALILASPTNFFTVTALFKRFMERLVVYAYWPWGTPAPKSRRRVATKRAVLITSAAAPALLGRLFFSTLRQLKATARTVGAKAERSIYIGFAAGAPDVRLGARDAKRIERAVARIA